VLQGKKQRKRREAEEEKEKEEEEGSRGRGGKQGCRGDQRGGSEHTRRTGRRSTEAGEQVRTGRSCRCGADGPLVDSSSQEEMQGRTRGRCARPVDSSKEQQASASASAAKKQGRRRRLLFSSPLSVKLQRAAPVVKALEQEVCRATAYMRSIPALFLLARTRRGRFPPVFIASARFPARFRLPLNLLLRRPPQASRRSPDAFPRLIDA